MHYSVRRAGLIILRGTPRYIRRTQARGAAFLCYEIHKRAILACARLAHGLPRPIVYWSVVVATARASRRNPDIAVPELSPTDLMDAA
jgi:hypothetical protein